MQVNPAEMEQVRRVTEILLQENNLTHFSAFANTVIKEFLQNGAKATQKQFFKNNGLDIDKNHKQAIEQFKESMSSGEIHSHLLTKDMDFLVELNFQEIDKKSLLISVETMGK